MKLPRRAGVSITGHAIQRWLQRSGRRLRELPTAAARAWCVGEPVFPLIQSDRATYAAASEGLIWIFEPRRRRLVTVYSQLGEQ